MHGALLGDALQPSPGTIASGAHTLVLTSVREPIELTLRSLDYVQYERCDDLTIELLDETATSVATTSQAQWQR